MTTAVREPAPRIDLSLGGAWPLALAFAVLAIPTMLTLGDETWSREAGAHGPIVIFTGAWLLWRQAPEFRSLGSPGNPVLTAAILLTALASYVWGRAYDFITLEALGVYGAGLAMIQAKFGARVMFKNWFPFFYLAFAVPPPGWLMDRATAPLKQFVSFVATEGLQLAGMPVSHQGVTIFVAQYQLLVKDACSGMNSLVGLTAISLFYIYLTHGASWRYSLVLTGLVIPIAVIANIIRIVILILLTYFFGDSVAQGFLHFAAGIVLFATALSLVFAIDRLIARFWFKSEQLA